MAKECFFSFHYVPDNWRVATVRSIGSIHGNTPASDNEWESIAHGPNHDARIEQWIDRQMRGRVCNIVLVGAATAQRKWINYEIIKAWNDGLGVVGIRIHGLKDSAGETASIGANPFDSLTHGPSQKPLSSLVKCYNPAGSSSKDRYDWISTHLANAVVEAISIRSKYQ